MGKNNKYKAIIDELEQIVKDTDRELTVKDSVNGGSCKLDDELGFSLVREVLFAGRPHRFSDEDLLKDYRGTKISNAARSAKRKDAHTPK